MPVNYSETPENVQSPEDTPLFRDWRPDNNVTNYYWSNAVPVTIAYLPITFGIKEVIGNPDFSQYTSFRLFKSSGYKPGTTTNWMNASVPPLSIDTPGLLTPMNVNGLQYEFTPNFNNLALQTVGVRDFFIKYSIQGRLSTGIWEIVSEYEHIIRLNVSNQLAVFTPTTLNYQHTKNTTLPSRDVSITGPLWKIQAPTSIDLSSVTVGVTIGTELNEFGQNRNYASGSGDAVITATLTSSFNSPTLSPGTYNETFRVLSGSTIVGTIPVTIVIASVSSLYSTPISLSFSAIKGIEEPINKLLFVFCSTSPYTIEKSSWLTMQVIGVGSGGNATDFRVKPIPTSNMEPGAYVGFIKIKDTVDGIDIEVNIPVTYILEGFVTNPYPSGKLAFTLDQKFFNFSTTNFNTYMQLKSTIKVYDFFTDIENTYEIAEKVPLFQGKGKINFGQTIHKLMRKLNNLNESLFQYLPANFSMLTEEISIETGEVIRDAFLQEQKFVAGLSNDINYDIGFLEFNKKPIRVTTNSIYIFNILTPDNSNYELRIFKNNNFIQSVPLGSSLGHIMTKKISFDNFIQGDIVHVTLEVVGVFSIDEASVPKKTFYVLPNQKYSWNIFWENEFLLQSVLECTGGLSSKSDFEYKTNNLFQNLVEVMEHIETTKISKITASTGWILSTQIDDIESLMRSKRVWFDLGYKQIELRPISKTKIDIDTDRELIEYSIEFQINRSYDQETYTF